MSRAAYRSPRAAASRHVNPRPADWTAALDLAQRLGALAASGLFDLGNESGLDLVRLRLMVRDLTADSFPSPSPVARLVAGAFLNIARAFAHIDAAPEARTACAEMLTTAARLTDDLWTAHRTHQAQSTWGRQGSFD